MYISKESLYGNAKSKFILIKDTVALSGVKLLKTIVKMYHKESVNLHIIYFEFVNGNFFTAEESGECCITKTDAFSDAYNWNYPDGIAQNLRSLDCLMKICKEFKGVICLDSLSPLLFHNNAVNIYKALHKILKENTELQLLALMHSDVHDSYESDIIERLASTVLHVIPCKGNLLATVHYSSGKVSNQLVEYSISDSFEFCTLRDINPEVKSAPLKKPDPTVNLTFNLKLKDSEKEARSQLQLPYMQMQNKNDVIELESDMYDDEDPDDDLDI